MRSWRDGAFARVIQTEGPTDVADTRTAGTAFVGVSESLWNDYLAWKVFGKCNPVLEERLLDNTLRESFRSAGLPLLTAVLALDQQMSFPRSAASEQRMNTAVTLLVKKTSAASSEIAYIAEDLKALRAQRNDQLKQEAAAAADTPENRRRDRMARNAEQARRVLEFIRRNWVA